jgi:hypothetical protein
MTTITEARPPVKAGRARRPAPRVARLSPPVNGCHALELAVGKDVCRYWLEPLASDFGRAFRLEKWDTTPGTDEEQSAYELVIDPAGFSSCTCKGWCRHQRCKHLAGLAALIAEGRL